MTTSAAPQDTDGLPESSVVESDDSPAAGAAPADSIANPPATQAAQEKPSDKKGDAPAKASKPDSGTDATAKRNDPQKRIDRLTRRLRDAERETAYERGRREALEHMRSGNAADAAAQVDPRPKLDDFDSAEDFAEALADWKVRNPEGKPSKPTSKASAEPKAGSQAPPREPAEGEAPKPSETAVKSYTDAKAKYPDLDEVLFGSGLPWTIHMAHAVEDLENSAEVLYHLGQDEEEMERIATLSPKQQEREVWRFAEELTAKLAASQTPDKKPGSDAGKSEDGEPQTRQQPRATVTQAQPVPSTVSGSAPAGKSIEDMSEEEYIAYMDERERKAGRRSY